MIRFNLLFNLIFIGLLSPAMSIALPIQITVLKVNVGKRYNELIIVHDAPVETKKNDPRQAKSANEAYQCEWGKIILKHSHDFMWYCEGNFNSFLGKPVLNSGPISRSCDIFFMERPVELLGQLSSAAVDVRVLGNLYHPREIVNDQLLPYLNETQLSTVLTYLKEAQQSINNYGSDTAKRHASDVIELTEQAQHWPYEKKMAHLNSLEMLHIVGHFDVVTLGSILFALANYQEPSVLICGAIHADNLIELLCSNHRASIVHEITSVASNTIRIQSIITALNKIELKAHTPPLQQYIDALTNLTYCINQSEYEEEAQRQLLLQELFLLRENDVAHQHLTKFVELADIERTLAEVAARNPIQHSALRSRP